MTNQLMTRKQKSIGEIKMSKYLSWIGEDEAELDGEFYLPHGEVLHESEFLRVVMRQIEEIHLCEQSNGIGSEFLASVTGIEESVFSHLIENQDDLALRSIIKATVGMYDFSKKALDYYGVAHFMTTSGSLAEIHPLGDGFYYFKQDWSTEI
ncbi:hypothetical protein MHB71_15345 [Paenibacillus sp. FSL H7-0940]|uniref:hypothetical protein n=1 Tax=Paenibacillus sp. FSL H7-0940 TaxID=2921443 RepID=UPI0030EC5145